MTTAKKALMHSVKVGQSVDEETGEPLVYFVFEATQSHADDTVSEIVIEFGLRVPQAMQLAAKAVNHATMILNDAAQDENSDGEVVFEARS